MSLFTKIYDPAMRPIENAGLQRFRKDLVGKARKHVLEIGCGTGLNFPFYNPATLVTAVDPNPGMLHKAKHRAQLADANISVMQGSVEELPFPADIFDSVVCTLVLCSVPNVDLALAELTRVCKPGGTMLFMEHVRAQQPVVGKIQDFLTPAWKKLCDGCCLNRNTRLNIERAKIETTSVQYHYGHAMFILEGKNMKE
ncbi:class I SAM-dependent methyltransferase [Ectobacillus sp. sgz5001026]|uniref:class I SAM-dependent methyltransferase n=1 Tax=Ectobacillus sp. sgz5001026 TaxID=3242473 RepID=UPI0036D35551